MNAQENNQTQQDHTQESDLTHQEYLQEHENDHLEHQENHQIQEPQHPDKEHPLPLTMTSSSSPPPKPSPQPPSPPLHSTYSSAYVFSPPEALNYQETTTTGYQSPPPHHSYVYSPDISPVKPPSQLPSPPAPQDSGTDSKSGPKTQDQELGGSKKRSYFYKKDEVFSKRALLGCRVLGFLCCLVSFSIMAADKNQGWAIDSFYRYKELRYCMSVAVIGFVYAGLQSYKLAYSLSTGKFNNSDLRRLLDFSLDQILTYLLLSASSTAAFRVEDWESNWGTDKFPSMARSSVVLSFLAFVAFAFCSLLSGQIHFTPHSA